MTDRHAAYLVILDKDLREDDAEPVLNALGMVKGVTSVEPVQGDMALQIATQRARRELHEATRRMFMGLDEQ